MTESKLKKLETLFCWAEFYTNSKNLKLPTLVNTDALKKVQVQINNLRKEVID